MLKVNKRYNIDDQVTWQLDLTAQCDQVQETPRTGGRTRSGSNTPIGITNSSKMATKLTFFCKYPLSRSITQRRMEGKRPNCQRNLQRGIGNTRCSKRCRNLVAAPPKQHHPFLFIYEILSQNVHSSLFLTIVAVTMHFSLTMLSYFAECELPSLTVRRHFGYQGRESTSIMRLHLSKLALTVVPETASSINSTILQ